MESLSESRTVLHIKEKESFGSGRCTVLYSTTVSKGEARNRSTGNVIGRTYCGKKRWLKQGGITIWKLN